MTDLKMTAKRVAELLGLARSVYGADAAWRDESELRLYVRKDCGAIEIFDPANNSGQFVEVLAWLFLNDPSSRIESDCVFFDDGERDYERPLLHVEHNGTAADIRRAVVEAAIRVANA